MNDEQACRQAYDDFYHKVRAEVGYDHWAAIWRFIRKRGGEPVATIRHFQYEGIARNGPSQEAVMIDGAPVLPDGTQLYAAAPAVQGEPVVHTFYVLHDSAEGQKYIKKDISDGCLMIFEREEDARRAKRQHSGTDYKRVDYYTAPQPAEQHPDDAAVDRFAASPTSTVFMRTRYE